MIIEGFQKQARVAPRRGVLLLVVLSVLSLFMMLGITYVIMASRSRALSRGFARMTTGAFETRLPVRQLLDEAALLVIRGKPLSLTAGTNPTSLGTSGSFAFESILADQYGNTDPFAGTTSTAVQGAGPLCSTTVTFAGSTTPAHGLDLAGCVLTLLPKTGKPSSHRIIRAEPATVLAPGSPVRLVFANFSTDFEKTGTSTGSTTFNFPAAGTTFKINGRVHSGTGTTNPNNEPWDGYDFPANSFLAHVEPVPATPSAANVIRPSMFDTTTTAALNDASSANDDLNGDGIDDRADNDNDGIYDGWFFNPGFPKIYSSSGNEILVHMSCLVLDMDGRLNVNAHGSVVDLSASGTNPVSMLYPPNHAGWGSAMGTMPMGSGYGPAEINGGSVFAWLTGTNGSSYSMIDNPWRNLLVGGSNSVIYSGSVPRPGDRLLSGSYAATIGIEGRYGRQANPVSITGSTASLTTISSTNTGSLPMAGLNGVDDLVGKENEAPLLAVGIDPRWAVDLHGRLKTEVSPGGGGTPTPTLSYRKPDTAFEFQDDPYEIRLDYSLRRTGLNDPRTSGTAASEVADNPFSPAEFERLLRPYDDDSHQLPSRLATLIGSQAEASRLVVTTDSWDTISITGTAANRIYSWFKSATGSLLEGPSGYISNWNQIENGTKLPNNLLPWELAAGQRVALTRYLDPTDPGIQRKLLFKDLYVTALALTSGTTLADQCAQWAANVIEYQDADSIMTGYEYDPNPKDGWTVDGDLSTAEPNRQIVWGAERPELVIAQTIASSQGVSGSPELHVVLNHPWNAVFSTGSAAVVAEPVAAELRGSALGNVNLVRSATGSAGPSSVWQLATSSGTFTLSSATSSTLTSGTEVGPGAWAVISSTTGPTINTSGSGTPTARLVVPSLSISGSWVQLQRLADPTKPYEAVGSGTAPNPYVVLDASDATIGISVGGTVTYGINTRNGWNTLTTSATSNFAPGITPSFSTTWSGTMPWLAWPNRPLVSPAELLLVPGFTCFSTGTSGTTGLLTNYVPPSGTNSGYLPNTGGTSTADWTALDVFTVPSRFAGTRQTVDLASGSPYDTAVPALHAGLYGNGAGSHQLPSRYNQLSLGREPGRVNINVIASDGVWQPVVQGPLPTLSLARSGSTGSLIATPAQTGAAALRLSGSSGSIYTDGTSSISDADRNPYHRFYTAMRLANTTTIRSHVFGIWVTIRTMETTGPATGGGAPPVDRDTTQYHRMFLLFDRSIPVAFEPGKNHNVRDAILLQRVIQ